MKLRSLLPLLCIFLLTFFTSCSEEDQTPDRPRITVPEGIQPATKGVPKDFTILVDIPGGYKSHAIKALNGIAAEKSSQPEEGAKSLEFVIMFTGQESGSALVELSISDLNSKIDDGGVLIEVSD
jgi:hypothetical protein